MYLIINIPQEMTASHAIKLDILLCFQTCKVEKMNFNKCSVYYNYTKKHHWNTVFITAADNMQLTQY